MSNNRKTASTAKKAVRTNKKAVKEKSLKGIYPQMYIGSMGICCTLNILKKEFIKRLLEVESENGFVSLSLFPLKEISKNNCTHFVVIKDSDDYMSEEDIVSNRIKELGL